MNRHILILMKWVVSIFSVLLIFLMVQITDAQTPKEFAEVWEKTHITDKFPSDVRHKDLKAYLDRLKTMGVRVNEVGRSVDNREIYQVEWGRGKTKIFMWSQMHGDEPTATPALIDMFAFLESNRRKKKWVRKLERTLTIRAVPMLNPDGAELFRRRNQQGIDINRDARNLETPEGALLMRLRNSFRPDIGFNLHNQQELTTVGGTTSQATISVLAVSANPENGKSEAQKRNERICALIIRAMNQFIPGNVARYDDGYTENAFGDTFSDMGTPVILIETGGLHGKNEMFLSKLNFIAFLTALQSLVDASHDSVDVGIYENLPENGGGRLFNFLFRNATIVKFREAENTKSSEPENGAADPGGDRVFDPFFGDIGINRDRRRAEITLPPIYVRRIGDLKRHRGLTEYNAFGFYVTAKNGELKPGRRGAIYFFKKGRKIDWDAEDFEERFPPDAIFARGRWLKGGEMFQK